MREYTIKVSGEEKQSLDEARQDIFGSDSVPYGETIQYLVDAYHE